MSRLNFGEAISTDLSKALSLGFDLVQISQIADSIFRFGDVFKQRLFTENELHYAHQGKGLCAERLAARFAAKEAVIKALNLGEAGIGWREIEVVKLEDGSCKIVLHGHVADLADKMGVVELLLSLTHDGDYAGAVVIVVFANPKFENSRITHFQGEFCGTN
jgi:holo-[acyl-carrier protein] synthase